MKNAPPKNAGTHIGLSVLYQPSDFQMTNDGIIVTCAGSIIVDSNSSIANDLPGQFSRANAYATNALLNSVPIVVSATSSTLFRTYNQNGPKSKARWKFRMT